MSLPNSHNTFVASRSRKRRRDGYTLLELILALGLSIVVVFAISQAIQMYMVMLTRQQSMIERKQVARGIMLMISNDLRAGVQYKAADYSDLENLAATQQTAQNAPTETEEEGDEEEEEEEELIVQEDEVAFRPAFFGNRDTILIDISRLPRLDEYNPLVPKAETAVQSPSDVKSLAYFYSASGGGVDLKVNFSPTSAPGGLYRREIDRAVAAYRGDTGLVTQPDEFTRLVANEVAEVQFRFFDGENWKEEWDSEEEGGFPTAVEIRLVIDPNRTVEGESYSYGGFDNNSMELYRSVVHLPISEPTAEEEE